MDKRTKKVVVRFTGKEYDFLTELSNADDGCKTYTGKNCLSKYVRKVLLSPVGSSKDMRKELKKLSYEVRKIGVNINQIAKRINAGYEYYSDESAVMKKLGEVERQLKNNLEAIENSIDSLREVNWFGYY